MRRNLSDLMPKSWKCSMSGDIKEIPIKQIVAKRFNPRVFFDPSYIKELSASISRDGQWNPIIVRPRADGKYDLIAGECRLRAIKKLRISTIKATILNVDDDEAYLLALKTNLMRQNLNPIEEAIGIERLLRRGWSKYKIARYLNKSLTWINYRLKLIKKGSKNLHRALLSGLLPLTYAVELANLPKTLQGVAVDKVIKDRLNLNEVKTLVKLLNQCKTDKQIASILQMTRDRLTKRMMSFRSGKKTTRREKKRYIVINCRCGVIYVVDRITCKVISIKRESPNKDR